MSTKLQRELAEQVLAGNSQWPAKELFRRGLECFVRARLRLRPLAELAVTPRKRIVRCTIPGRRGAKMRLYVGVLTSTQHQTYKSTDPDTGLTQVQRRKEERKEPNVFLQVECLSGRVLTFGNVERAAIELAYRCQGSTKRVDLVCAAIERARRRLFELADEATRWL